MPRFPPIYISCFKEEHRRLRHEGKNAYYSINDSCITFIDRIHFCSYSESDVGEDGIKAGPNWQGNRIKSNTIRLWLLCVIYLLILFILELIQE